VSSVVVEYSERQELVVCKKEEPLEVVAGSRLDGRDGSPSSRNGVDGFPPEPRREKGYTLVAAGNSFPAEVMAPMGEHMDFVERASGTVAAGCKGAWAEVARGAQASVGKAIEALEMDQCLYAAWKGSPPRWV